ncbi:MAG: metallophosphoesterase family protein [Victivallaceae bacterium]|jgi:diadenosine tetraphosphatase ApaH/serine/threonine PP2A family protein phosphatase|nr:metallophosphoesterase family protein [Victivallaceae bacterium]
MAKIAILSDIHSNYEALTAVLAKCDEFGVDKYVSVGDIVGYNADPSICLEMVRSLDLICAVKGNHDEYASSNDDLMEGFNPHAKRAVLWTKTQLTSEQRNWLANMPLRATVPGTNITIVHATLDSPDNWGYVFDLHHAADNFAYQFTQICFCGHSHVPVAFYKKPISTMSERPIEEILAWTHQSDEGVSPKDTLVSDVLSVRLETGYKYLFNIGSVGQPRNHDPRASFAIIDTDTKEVFRQRVAYDFHTTQKKVLEAGLPERLAARLEYGN